MTALSDRAKPIPKIVASALEVFPLGETTLLQCKVSKNLAIYKMSTL